MLTIDKKGRTLVPEGCEPWCDELLTAYYEARMLAEDLAADFWEKYPIPQATTLLHELQRAATEGKEPGTQGIQRLKIYQKDLTRALAAFYWLTVPATEHVALTGKEMLF